MSHLPLTNPYSYTPASSTGSHLSSVVPPRFIGLVIKKSDSAAFELASQIIPWLESRGVNVFALEDSALPTAAPRLPDKATLVRQSDMILVLGGDGTFLSVGRCMIERTIPILGVHMGTLGFLTEVKRGEVHEVLNLLLSGQLRSSERSLLSMTQKRGQKIVAEAMAVNDIVIGKAAIARILELELSVNGNTVTRMRADGLIVATPTGSTAYALAAGGPVVEPSVPALVLAPICPFSLAMRPVLVSEDATITIRALSQTEAVVTIDGQVSHPVEPDDEFVIARFQKHRLKMIQSPSRNYFGLLREKLQYGEGIPSPSRTQTRTNGA